MGYDEVLPVRLWHILQHDSLHQPWHLWPATLATRATHQGLVHATRTIVDHIAAQLRAALSVQRGSLLAMRPSMPAQMRLAGSRRRASLKHPRWLAWKTH